MFPSHFYHPLIVHFPVVLPFVIVGFLIYGSLVGEEKKEWIYLIVARIALINAVLVLAAFYSGQWAADGFVHTIEGEVEELFSWHAFLGRGALFISVTLAIVAMISTIATKHVELLKRTVSLLAIVLLIFTSIGGFTGGELVHKFEVNTLLD